MSARVREIEALAVDMALTEPFGIATGAQAVAENAFVLVTLEDGTRGVGEAAPFPAVNGETRARALADVARARGAVVGVDAGRTREIAATCDDLALVGSARAALECALLDAWLRSIGTCMWRYFGAASPTLRSDLTLTTGSAEQAAAAARAAIARGFTRLKVKVGGTALEQDEARLRAVVGAAPEAELLLDANGSLGADEAVQLVRSLGKGAERVVAFEQPTATGDHDAARRVREAGIFVVADESARSLADVRALVAERAADAVNLKITKSGLWPTVDMALAARASGLDLMIGGMVESKVAMGVSACFAAGLGGFDLVDLDTPWFLADPPTFGGWAERGPELRVDALDGGHGVGVRVAGRVLP